MTELAEVLTVREVAAFLCVDKVTVHRLLRAGRLRGAKVGRAWRVLRSELMRSLQLDDPPKGATLAEVVRATRPGRVYRIAGKVVT